MFEHGLSRMERQKGPLRMDRQQTLASSSSVGTPESSQEQWFAKRQGPLQKKSTAPPSIVSTFILDPGFRIDSINYQSYINFDNTLQIFYTLYKTSRTCSEYIDTVKNSEVGTSPPNKATTIVQIFDEIDKYNFNGAKALCLENLMCIDYKKLVPTDILNGEAKFVKEIANIFPIFVNYDCDKSCPQSRSRKVYPFKAFTIRSPDSIPRYYSRTISDKCNFCGQKDVVKTFTWTTNGALPIVIYNVDINNCALTEDKTPKVIQFAGSKFLLYAYTFLFKSHFSAVFVHGIRKFLFEAGKPTKPISSLPSNHQISTIWYIRDL